MLAVGVMLPTSFRISDIYRDAGGACFMPITILFIRPLLPCFDFTRALCDVPPLQSAADIDDTRHHRLLLITDES